jgi:ubiquinone/menaquinone biosynthesis C-methylase UbiE
LSIYNTLTSMPEQTYQQSHHTSTTSAHAARTAEVEAAFLLPHLRPDHRVLDIGCGPGSITRGLARYVQSGHVTGIDLSEQVLAQAQEGVLASGSASNITFEMGNVLEGLSYPDDTFDVVYCNQTLLHIPAPVKALKEMRRVCISGGLIAAREADMPFHWYPYNRGLQLWDKYLYSTIFGNEEGREHPMSLPHLKGYRGGSLLHVWAREAGFDPEKMQKGVGSQGYTTRRQRDWFVDIYSKRLENEDTRRRMKECGATEDELGEMLRGLEAWGRDVDGWVSILHGELIAVV